MTRRDPQDELHELFVQEGHENLDLLQASLLRIERSPADADAIRDAFRAAHSLKGMSAAMGQDDLAALTHALEDTLGFVRAGTVVCGAGLIGTMLEAVDAALAILEAFAEDRPPIQTSIITHLLERLRIHDAASVDLAPVATGPAGDAVASAIERGLAVYEIEVRPDEQSLMPAVRAYAAALLAQDHGELLHASPSLDDLEQGTLPDGTLRLVLASAYDEGRLRQEIASCTEIARAEVRAWRGDDAVRAQPADEAPASSDRGADTAAGGLASRSRTVRVDSDRLDSLMHSVGELLVRRARVETLARESGDPRLIDAAAELTRAAKDLQAMVMDVRMVSIDSVFRRLPRVVRDLGRTLDKDVDLQLTGADTELDRTVVDLIADPLVHLVRNAMDHGIEPADERRRKGKPERGTLAVSATAAGGVVLLRVRDDGSGMDPDAIRRTAVARGVVTREQASELTDEQALQLCFAPGFSTRAEVTELSGRGVGLDVVRSSVRSLGGDVAIDSSDEGTQMTIRLPLTLAIVPVLLVRCSDSPYALPMTRVRSIVDTDSPQFREIGGEARLDLGDRVLAVLDLPTLLGVETGTRRGRVVLVDGGDTTIALRVDDVMSQAEVVTRAIPQVVRTSPFLSASATLGDGEIAFVVDVEAIAEAATGSEHAA